MGKRANPMAFKATLTYEINEAAAALGKTPATVRSWIKDGLPVLSSRKPYLISGEAIRLFLRSIYEAATRLTLWIRLGGGTPKALDMGTGVVIQ
jgi:hypothetical protein